MNALLERPTVNADELILRPYQQEALDAIALHRNGVIDHPTGTGKALVLSLSRRALDITGDGVFLITAHRDELIAQLVDKVRKWEPMAKVGIEKAEQSADLDCQIVVGSIQTLQNGRLARFIVSRGDRIKGVGVDEVHRVASAQYMKLIAALREACPTLATIGVSATPARGDKRGIGWIMGDLIHYLDLTEAIADGYLVEPVQIVTNTSADISDVRMVAGDFSVVELGEAVDTDSRNGIIISTYMEHCQGMKAVVFAASVPHAQHLALAFQANGVRAHAIFGNLPTARRQEMMADFREGRVDVVTSFSVLIEGLDVPDVACVMMCRPSASLGTYKQMLGRSLRPLDSIARLLGPGTTREERLALIADSAKGQALVFDFADVCSKHNVVTMPDLWTLGKGFNCQGHRITEVREAYRELSLLDPYAAEIARSFTIVQTYIRMIKDGIPLNLPPRPVVFLSIREAAARAKAAGQKTFEGTPCSKCGATTRLTSSTRCAACRREHNTKWNAENPDKRRESDAKWQAANPDKKRERTAKWSAANPDKVRERTAKWRAENPDKKRENDAKWWAENPDKVREYTAKRYAKRKATRLAEALSAEAAAV
jgi:superfamily II DNA or RNA helicase